MKRILIILAILAALAITTYVYASKGLLILGIPKVMDAEGLSGHVLYIDNDSHYLLIDNDSHYLNIDGA